MIPEDFNARRYLSQVLLQSPFSQFSFLMHVNIQICKSMNVSLGQIPVKCESLDSSFGMLVYVSLI